MTATVPLTLWRVGMQEEVVMLQDRLTHAEETVRGTSITLETVRADLAAAQRDLHVARQAGETGAARLEEEQRRATEARAAASQLQADAATKDGMLQTTTDSMARLSKQLADTTADLTTARRDLAARPTVEAMAAVQAHRAALELDATTAREQLATAQTEGSARDAAAQQQLARLTVELQSTQREVQLAQAAQARTEEEKTRLYSHIEQGDGAVTVALDQLRIERDQLRADLAQVGSKAKTRTAGVLLRNPEQRSPGLCPLSLVLTCPPPPSSPSVRPRSCPRRPPPMWRRAIPAIRTWLPGWRLLLPGRRRTRARPRSSARRTSLGCTQLRATAMLSLLSRPKTPRPSCSACVSR